MREIKFRAWDDEEKKYYTVITLPCDPFNGIFSDIGKLVERPCSLEDDAIDVHFHGLIIEQYTGLKDKNGKEIYEGDICSVDDGENFYEIIFYMGGFMVAVLPRKIRIYHIGDSLFNNIEIIGNIHENPELIK